MCPHMDAMIFKKSGKKKILSVVLSEDEDILSSIKEAMKQHNLKECRVEDMNGTIKEGHINYFEGNSYKSASLVNRPILKASGNFKLTASELWGSMHVSTAEKRPTTGTLVEGTAAEGLQIKMSFVEIEP